MEEEDLDFNIELKPLSLKEFGVIAVASNPNIWNLHLSDLIKPIIEAQGTFQINIKEQKRPYLYQLKDTTLRIISGKLNLQTLPTTLATVVKFKILELCDLIYDWTLYLIMELQLPSEYARKIYFTSKGNIDVVRIFKSYWRKITDVTPSGWLYQKFKLVHCLACLFDVETVRRFQTDIINEILSMNPGFQMNYNADPEFQIIANIIHYYKMFLNGIQLHFTTQLNKPYLTAITMLQICYNSCFYEPFVYFYNHLNAVEEQNYLEKISLQYIWDWYDFKTGKTLIRLWKENLFQINMFLMKKMNASQKINFILNNLSSLFSHFLRKKSYQKFLFILLDKFLSHYVREKNGAFYTTLLDTLVQVIGEIKALGLPTGFYEQLFGLVMQKIPKNNKTQIFKLECLKKSDSLIHDIYNYSHIPLLRVILNDQDLEELKAQLIKTGKFKFQSLLKCKKYDALNEFQALFLNSRKLADEFDKAISYILQSWMLNYRFDDLNNYLTWRYGESTWDCKTQTYAFWCSLVPKYFRNIKGLLIWFFGKNEVPTVKNCNDQELKLLKQLCQELIYNIWFRPNFAIIGNYECINYTATLRDLSTEILVSCFISEEEIAKYKKTELVKDESCVRFYCEYAVKNYDDPEVKHEYIFEVIDEFFEFCSLPTDKIEMIKKLIGNNIEEWIEKCGANENRLEVVVLLLDWVYGKRPENQEMLINFFQDKNKVIGYYESKNK